jgi:FkbM family methyltransferase
MRMSIQARLSPSAMASSLWQKARWSAVRRLARGSGGYALFRALGRCYGVHDIRVLGDYGLVEGGLQDTAILMAYARTRVWARRANSFIVDALAGCAAGTYIDIGANIGLTTLPVAANARIRCHAFEPEPTNYSYLVRNVAVNCVHGNVVTHNMALFDRKGALDFALSDRNFGDHRIEPGGVAPARGGRPIITVQADRLDNLLDVDTLPSPVVVKIDTQGAEAQVFAGASRTLSKATAIVFEFSPHAMTQMGGDVAFMTDFVARQFDCGAVVPGEGEDDLIWQPISEVTRRMTSLLRAGADRPDDYHDIYVRKTDGGAHVAPALLCA